MATIMAESQSRTLTEQFMLRLPDGMRDRIKAAAESNNRSMNAEIVATLETAYPEPLPEKSNDPVVQFLLNEIAKLRALGAPRPTSQRAFRIASLERAVREAMMQGQLPFDALGD